MPKKPARVEDAQLREMLRELKSHVPKGAIVALFIFQDAGAGRVITDCISNTPDGPSLTAVIETWCEMRHTNEHRDSVAGKPWAGES